MQCIEVAVSNSHCRHERMEEDEVIGRGSIEQSRDRSPKTLWSPFTRADELVDDSVLEACCPYSRARRNRDREALDAAEVWRFMPMKDLERLNVEAGLPFIS